MTNYNKIVEDLMCTSNDAKFVHKQNFKNIPTSWIKFGEVFCNKLEQPIFVCSICLKNADSINTAFTACDGAVFWSHIQQQHISGECETIEKIAAEIKSFEAEEDSEMLYDKISSKINENAELNDDPMKQNHLKLLEEFHENLVKKKATEETKKILQNPDIKTENKQIQEKNLPHDVNDTHTHETVLDFDIKIEIQQDYDNNRLPDIKESNAKEKNRPNTFKGITQCLRYCNYSYNENEAYTVSDDEDGDEKKNQEVFINDVDSNVGNFLKHNDMIEISDDESSEDNVETRPNSPKNCAEQTVISEAVEKLENYKGTKFNGIKESNLCQTNLVNCIPTPDISPCESSSPQEYNITLDSQVHKSTPDINEDFTSKEMKHLDRSAAQTFRSFQCELCGSRTVNEKNMQLHLEKFHKSLLLEFGTNKNYIWQYYHQLHPSYQIKQNYVHDKLKKNLFKCEICKRTTKTLKAMERHQHLYHSHDTHVVKKQCQICHKLIRVENFKQHMEIHFSARFQCSYCGAAYKQKQYLNNHISKYHIHGYLNPLAGFNQQFNTTLYNTGVPYEANFTSPTLTPEEEQQFMYQKFIGVDRPFWEGDKSTPKNA